MYEFYIRGIYILLCAFTAILAVCICCSRMVKTDDKDNHQSEEERARYIRKKIICKKVKYYQPTKEQKVQYPLTSIMEEVITQPNYDVESPQIHEKKDEEGISINQNETIASSTTFVDTATCTIKERDIICNDEESIISSKSENDSISLSLHRHNDEDVKEQTLNNSTRSSSSSRSDNDYHLLSRKGSILISRQNTRQNISIADNISIKLSSIVGKNEKDSSQSIHDFPSISTCSICFQNYDVGDDICWSKNENCKHCFHVNCITSWLMKHENCPLCRENYLIKSSSESSL